MNLFLKPLKELGERVLPHALFLTVSGSHLYGFSSVDSDIDVRGAFLAPTESILGMMAEAETVERRLDLSGVEVEVVAHEAAKYFRLMCRHNGYILEQVFSPLVVTGGPFLERLRPLAKGCITRGCHEHYRGFYRSQFAMLQRESPKKAKSLLYAYRVLLTGIHLLRTGNVEANLPVLAEKFSVPYIGELIARKHAAENLIMADLDWTFHAAELARWAGELDRAYEDSTLPEEPPREELHRFLIDLRREEMRHG